MRKTIKTFSLSLEQSLLRTLAGSQKKLDSSRRTAFFAIILILCILTANINVYASDFESITTQEHVFTYAELACMSDAYSTSIASSDEEFVKVNNIQEAAANASSEYYIIEMSDGYMLTSPTSGTFSRTRYSNDGLNNARKWIFAETSNGIYTVYSYTDRTKCLTVDPSSKVVTLSAYTGSEFQKWKMYVSPNGNALTTNATDSRVAGYKLLIGATSCTVSSASYTPVGFFNVSWYVPVTSLSYPSFYLAPKQQKEIRPNKTPSNSVFSNNWSIWSSNSSSVFTVTSKGTVTGVKAGAAILTFTDKITRKYGSCTITVTEIPNGTYYLKNKHNSEYARVKDGIMTNGQNVVQYDFDESSNEQWIFTLNTVTGYYSIKSANSSSLDYYMAVSDDSSANDKPIVIRSATETTLTDGMKWKISKTTSGAYKIIPKTGETTDYVLSTSTWLGTNNAILLQSNYILNDSYRDEWFLFDVAKKYSQVSLGFSSASSLNSSIKQYYESNSNAYGATFTSISKSDFINEMRNSAFFCGVLHGGEHEDKLLISSSEILYLSEISSLPASYFDSAKIIILTSCYSGRANGFVDTLLSKGADVVIGFRGKVEQETGAFWTDRLIYSLSQGNTVQAAIDFANDELRNKYNSSYYDEARSLIIDELYTGISDLSSTPCA